MEKYLTSCLGRYTLALNMTQEIPDWLKKTSKHIKITDQSSQQIFSTDVPSQEIVAQWFPVAQEIGSYVDKWNFLEINRIFADVSRHIFGLTYAGTDTPFSAQLSIADKLGNMRSLTDRYGRQNQQKEPVTNTVMGALLTFAEEGVLPGDISFGKLTTKMNERFSGGSRDNEYEYYETRFNLQMDKTTVSLNKESDSKPLFIIALAKLKSPQDLEAEVDSFFEGYTKQKREEQEAQKEIEEDHGKRATKLQNILSELKITHFLKVTHPFVDTHYVNIDKQSNKMFQPWIIDWTKGEDAVVLKITSTDEKIINGTTRGQYILRGQYSLIIITSTGRIGIPTREKTVLSRHTSEFPAGGRGLVAASQINKNLENIILDLKNNPRYVSNRPYIPDTTSHMEM